MAPGHVGIELSRSDLAERHLELADSPELWQLLHTAADAGAGIAVAADRDQHMVGDAGDDGADRELHRG